MPSKYQRKITRRMVREMAVEDRPINRLVEVGPQAMATTELLAAIIQSSDALSLAEEVLTKFGSLPALARATETEITSIAGMGRAQYSRLKAAFEVGRRVIAHTGPDRVRIVSPADAANLVMSEMMDLEQEHLRVILLNTRNEVIGVRTIYIGSLNTSVVRVGEIYRCAIRENAAAMIVVHNHPSGDPSPSPEDINVTRSIVQAGKLLDIELLDHVVIGRNRFVSLKERGFMD